MDKSSTETLCLPSAEQLLTDGAFETDSSKERVLSEHRFDPFTKTWLTQVVMGLSGIKRLAAGEVFALLEGQHKDPVTDLDQRVATALRQLLLQLSQAVCHAEILLLEGMELGVVSEETILRLEQKLIDCRHFGCDLVKVPDCDSGLSEIPGGTDSSICRGNE